MAGILSSDHSDIADQDIQKYEILEPLTYLYNNGSRNRADKFKHGVNCWVKIPEEQMKKGFAALETYMFTIWAVDDICDESPLREAVPTSHLVFGMAKTVNAMNYAFSAVLQKLIELEKPEYVSHYLEHNIKLFRGQGLEIYWRNNGICPTEEEYMKFAVPKASSAANLLYRILEAFTDNKEDFTKIVTDLGSIAQILNDYSNLQSTQYNSLKGYCMDITEGTFTFPLIHAVQTHPEDDQVFNIVKEKSKDVDKKKHCISLLEKYGSFEYTKKTIKAMIETVIDDIKELPRNPQLEAVLQLFLLRLDPEASLMMHFESY